MAILTWQGDPELTPDDRLFAQALRARGASVDAVVWDETHGDRFDLRVLRSTWDYHLRAADFAERVRLWADDSFCRTLNPPAALAWNMDKNYLVALARDHGVAVVPTRIATPALSHFAEAADGLSSDSGFWVIKPTVSASARETWRVDTAAAITLWDSLGRNSETGTRSFLLQPYLSGVESIGERSLVWIGGRFTHAIQKRPAAGDFRVQQEFGGVEARAEPDQSSLDLASAALRAAAQAAGLSSERELLFARIDLLPLVSHGLDSMRFSWRLGEIELIEPALSLAQEPAAAELMADAALALL